MVWCATVGIRVILSAVFHGTGKVIYEPCFVMPSFNVLWYA